MKTRHAGIEPATTDLSQDHADRDMCGTKEFPTLSLYLTHKGGENEKRCKSILQRFELFALDFLLFT